MHSVKALVFVVALLAVFGCRSDPVVDRVGPPDEDEIPRTRSAEAQFELDGRLILAAHAADLAEVERLLLMGADPNAVAGERADVWFDTRHIDRGYAPIGSREWTPLLACTSNWATVAEGRDLLPVCAALLDAGADIDASDSHGATALYTAIRRHDTELALYLIRRGAEVNTETRFYIDAPEGSPLWLAARQGDRAVVRALIRAGADVNYQSEFGQPALVMAIRSGDIDIVHALIEAGADVNATQRYTEQIAGHGEIAYVATPLLVTLDQDKHQAFRIDIFDLLIDAGAVLGNPAKVDAADAFWTAQSHPEVVRDLIALGLSPMRTGRGGLTAIHVAAMDPMAHESLREMLGADGVDADVRDDGNDTPLTYALLGIDTLNNAVLLLESGADPNGGHGPHSNYLRNAIVDRNVSAVAVLLAYGADPTVEDPQGGTLLESAESRSSEQSQRIAAILRASLAAREAKDQ